MTDTKTAAVEIAAVERAYRAIFAEIVTQFYFDSTGSGPSGSADICVRRFQTRLAKARLAREVTLKIMNEEPSDE